MNFFLKTFVVTACFCSHIFASQSQNLLSHYTYTYNPREIEAYHATAASRKLRLKLLRQREAMRTQKNTISSSSSDGFMNKNSQRPTSISSSSVEESSSSFEEVYSGKEITKVIERLASSGTTIIATSSGSSTTEELLSSLTKTKSEVKKNKQTIALLQDKLTISNTKLDNANKKIIVLQQQVDVQQNKTPNNQITTQQELKDIRIAKQQLFSDYGVTTKSQLKIKLYDACRLMNTRQTTSPINKKYSFAYCCGCGTINVFPKEDTQTVSAFTCGQGICVKKGRQ